MHDEMQPQNPEMNNLPSGEPDHEGAMARADLYKLANYSLKLFKQMEDNAQLEAWVQAKITKAADYIASVYHYLEYEMKFSDYAHHLDNSDTLSESQKIELKTKLMEAKSKVSELKKAQAEKQTGTKKIKEEVSKDACNQQPGDDFDETMGETMSSSKEDPCPTCHGTGHVAKPERQVPEALKAKVAAYNRKAKAMSAAVKRVDANKNGIPDDLEDQEVEEDFEGLNKAGDTAKTSKGGTVTKTSTGIRHTPDASKFTDEPHTEPKSIAKSKSASEKKAEKEKEVKLPKHPKDKTWGMKGGEKFGQGAPKAKKEKEVDETYGQGVYEGKKKAKPDFLDMDKDGNKKEPFKKAVKDAKVKESLKGGQKKLDVDHDGDIEADDLADLRAKKAKKVEEAKPSAGMSKGEKSAVVKKAKAGGDIGKPGKGFAKVEKAAKAGGAKDPKAVAAAAMWKAQAKNESVDTVKAINESAELDRMKQFLTRLNG